MELPNMKLARSCALSLSNDPAYVLNFASQQSTEGSSPSLFAAAVSGTNEGKVYSKDTFCSRCSLVGHKGRITAMKFDLLNSHIIYSASLDGTLRYWNMKEGNPTGLVFSEKEVGYSALDINCNGTVLVAGVEATDRDAADEKESKRVSVTVEFWDISNVNDKAPVCLYEFDSIHSDDITSIAFHPKDPDVLVTGSTDGLVTVLNIASQVEDTALLHTLNTESSVNIIGYFGPSFEFIYVLTDIETLTIWKYMEGDLLTNIIDLKKQFASCNNIDYVVGCIYHKLSERLFLVGGTQDGRLEVLHVNLDIIEPCHTLKGGHSSIIRCISYEPGHLLTGAEDGMVCAWMELDNAVSTAKRDDLKVTKKTHKQKRKDKKPYKDS